MTKLLAINGVRLDILTFSDTTLKASVPGTRKNQKYGLDKCQYINPDPFDTNLNRKTRNLDEGPISC